MWLWRTQPWTSRQPGQLQPAPRLKGRTWSLELPEQPRSPGGHPPSLLSGHSPLPPFKEDTLRGRGCVGTEQAAGLTARPVKAEVLEGQVSAGRPSGCRGPCKAPHVLFPAPPGWEQGGRLCGSLAWEWHCPLAVSRGPASLGRSVTWA